MAGYQIESPAVKAREAAARLASRAKRNGRLALLVMALLILTAWAFGYAQGYFDGIAGRATVFQSKEST